MNNIEYLGINVANGMVLTKKYYYHWDSQELTLPEYLKSFLKPFDYGKRDNVFDYSVSCFIKSCDSTKLSALVNYAIDTCHIVIDKKCFCDDFMAVADLTNQTHYDPIVSFKFSNGHMTGISFYITALKDKSLMFEYLEIVKRVLHLQRLPEVSELVNKCVFSRCSDMFQVSWDFSQLPQVQNKLYLKVKDIATFSHIVDSQYNHISNHFTSKGFRFCEFAFVISNGILKMFNLYFKPL